MYPDLIRVSVALDDGDIVGFEANGYLSNHRERDLAAPAVSVDTAQKKVSGDLAVLSSQLTLIPTAGEYEVLCLEFKCATGDGRHVIVYVNALTGEEEKILLLLEDETGTLVI
jgi:germination protein YpeB